MFKLTIGIAQPQSLCMGILGYCTRPQQLPRLDEGTTIAGLVIMEVLLTIRPTATKERRRYFLPVLKCRVWR
jgi:hypothetical protein